MTTATTIAHSVEFGLRVVGFWPNMPYAWLFRYVWTLITGIIQACQYWYILIHIKTNDLAHLIDVLSVALEYSVMYLKLIILWFNNRHNICTDEVTCRSIFYNVLATMATDWREATVNDMNIMMSKASLSRYFSNAIIGLLSATSVAFGINVLMSYTDYNVDEIETPSREFLIQLQLPFECDQSPRYELLTCLEFIHQFLACIVNGMLNSLMITLVLHASGQIDILCDALKGVSPEKYNQRLVASITGQLINKHQKIITFSNKISDIFCYMALIQFMSSTLVICCLGLIIVTSISTMSESVAMDKTALMKAVVFYMAATSEAFVFCACGEYLSTKSKKIGDAAYTSFWYDLNPNDTKLLLFIILRSQRKLTITAGKIMDLSLEGFTAIIRGSLSYMSVLHAMY